MTNEEHDGLQKNRRRMVIFRSISVLVILFFLQGGVAYGTLQLFLALPANWTGIIDDADIERLTGSIGRLMPVFQGFAAGWVMTLKTRVLSKQCAPKGIFFCNGKENEKIG